MSSQFVYFKPIIREFPNRVTQPASFLRVLIKINIFQQNESFDFLRANSRIVTQTAGSPFNKPVFTKMFLQKSRPFTARKNQNTKTQKKSTGEVCFSVLLPQSLESYVLMSSFAKNLPKSQNDQ